MKTELEVCKTGSLNEKYQTERDRCIHHVALQMLVCIASNPNRVHNKSVIKLASWCWSVEHVRDHGPLHQVQALECIHRHGVDGVS